ncbi:MAG: hypothetical protein NT018_11925 [Armatimonadetes bacterium]|nr:hypothetical protein [Armatimonadota bacterium]
MKIACTASYPNENQLRELGDNFYKVQDFGLIVGKEYLVLGLSYDIDSCWGNAITVSFFEDDHLVRAPIILFSITDPRVSRHWEARKAEDGSLSLWPALFYEDFFHDRLSDYEQEAREAFHKVYLLLDNEYT